MIVAAIVTTFVVAFVFGLFIGFTNFVAGDGKFLEPAMFWFWVLAAAQLVMWSAGLLIWWVWSVAS